MFEMKITVEIDELHELCGALHAVADAITAAGGRSVKPAETIMEVAAAAHEAPAIPKTEHDIPAAPSPVDAAPEKPAAPEVRPVTLEELAGAGVKLIDAGKMPQLLALLAKFQVQAVTQLKPEQFDAFAAELRALGAQI